MYDLASPIMKAQFNLINKSNQSIKLSVNIISKPSKKKNLSNYTYNKKVFFKYTLNIKNSHYILDINLENKINNHFYKSVIGSFIYDNSINN